MKPSDNGNDDFIWQGRRNEGMSGAKCCEGYWRITQQHSLFVIWLHQRI
jgi:hypothetical protein